MRSMTDGHNSIFFPQLISQLTPSFNAVRHFTSSGGGNHLKQQNNFSTHSHTTSTAYASPGFIRYGSPVFILSSLPPSWCYTAIYIYYQ